MIVVMMIAIDDLIIIYFFSFRLSDLFRRTLANAYRKNFDPSASRFSKVYGNSFFNGRVLYCFELEFALYFTVIIVAS